MRMLSMDELADARGRLRGTAQSSTVGSKTSSPAWRAWWPRTGGLGPHIAADEAFDLLVRERSLRRLCRGKDAIDDLIRRRQAATLQPEDDVGAARHRADLDFLLPADQARRDGRVDGIHQRSIAFSKRLDDRRGVDTRGRPECVG